MTRDAYIYVALSVCGDNFEYKVLGQAVGDVLACHSTDVNANRLEF
jgi:hypothetical protein